MNAVITIGGVVKRVLYKIMKLQLNTPLGQLVIGMWLVVKSFISEGSGDIRHVLVSLLGQPPG